MPYDLLVKGGHVLDPGQGLDGRMDIGITGGKIAAIQAEIPASEARRVVQVKGDSRYVTPGLIDLHTHVGPGYWGIEPDPIAWYTGVTTWVDAGSAGATGLAVMGGRS